MQNITSKLNKLSAASKAAAKIQKQLPPVYKILEKNKEIHSQIIQSYKKYKNGLANFKYLVSKDIYVSTKVLDNLELSSISELSNVTKKSNTNNLLNYILSSFEERINDVFSYLDKTFPNRKHIFDEIKQLYELGFYTSLVTLCYCQADGMSNERWGFAFFDTETQKKNHELKIKSLKTKRTPLTVAILGQLKQSKNELTLYSKDSIFNDNKTKLKTLNRHMVIHGHSIYYGKKENAIRAILLLEFICDLANNNFQKK